MLHLANVPVGKRRHGLNRSTTTLLDGMFHEYSPQTGVRGFLSQKAGCMRHLPMSTVARGGFPTRARAILALQPTLDGSGLRNELSKKLRPELGLCEKVIASLARRRCLSEDEREDFSSWARLRLVENGDAILGRFQGESSLSTYLTTVVLNLFRDYRIAKWGKYRPSAAARRLGTVAVRLEMLIARDGLALAEAVEVLRRNEGVRESAEDLETIAAQLPPRAPRRFEGEEALVQVPSTDRTEDRALRGEAVEAARRVEAALGEALSTLSGEDRVILKLRIQDGFSVADVARTLALDQKPLYRRIEQLAGRLRHEMEARGIRTEDVESVVGCEEAEVRVDYGIGRESPSSRPSKREGER